MGLPPCLQALHPGIPDETSATRSIIRSFHVMIISRGGEEARGRHDYANYDAITMYSRDRRLSRLPVNHARLKLAVSISWLTLRFRGISDLRSDLSGISACQLDS